MSPGRGRLKTAAASSIQQERRVLPIQKLLREAAEPGYAQRAASFFKTGPGTYGEGDQFLGVRVPDVRAVARADDGLVDVARLMGSRWHEDRLLGVLILVRRFERGGEAERKTVVDSYLGFTERINNWDLVDLSASQILGAWLLRRPRGILNRLVASPNLWERRIAIVATFAFIRERDLEPTFALTKNLLSDPEDLMHKACGWMLREAGKRDVSALEEFLLVHIHAMPRTMLRYAIERFPERRRQELLKL